jgi:hypothetical protein
MGFLLFWWMDHSERDHPEFHVSSQLDFWKSIESLQRSEYFACGYATDPIHLYSLKEPVICRYDACFLC